MTAEKSEYLTEAEIIQYYYDNFYTRIFSKKILKKGQSYFHTTLEKFWQNENPRTVLECGGGSGEHIKFVKKSTISELESYVNIDKRNVSSEFHRSIQSMPETPFENFKFVASSIQKMPFRNAAFDRIVVSCVMHHVDSVYDSLSEIRRVLKPQGELAIALPADPGLLNMISKRLLTYRVARKEGLNNPELTWALEHRNSLGNILRIARAIFHTDEMKVHYRPFMIPTRNLNLMVVLHVVKSSA